VTAASRMLGILAIHRSVAMVTVVMPTLAALLAIWTAIRFGISTAEIVLVLVMHTLCIIGVEMGFHRHFAHRSFKAGAALRSALIIFGSMAAQGPVTQWVCDHRKHHRFTDVLGDPHSPHVPRGGLLRQLWHAHTGWLFTRDLHDPTVYAKDLLRDYLLMRISRLYHLWVLLGILLPGLILYTVEGGKDMAFLKGMLYGGGLRIFIGHHAVWSINSFGHYFGRRQFNTRECSRNNIWLAILTLGGGWHNNHHGNPTSAINSTRWWQIDPIGLLILLLGRIGVIRDIRRIGDGAHDETRVSPDKEGRP